MEIKLLLFFGLPVYKIKINPLLYNKKYYIKTIEKNYLLSSKRDKLNLSNNNIHTSYSDNDNKKFIKIDWINISKIYNNIFLEFTKSLNLKENFKYDYNISSYVAKKNNQSMVAHQHLPNCDFSCVHYIKYPKGSSPIKFINTNNFANYIQFIRPDIYKLYDKLNLINSYMFSNFNFTPEEDDLIIFPSCLMHEVPQSESNTKDLRISIVTNLNIFR